VEIKNDGSDPKLAERVVAVLREEDFFDQCLVMSLDLGSVRMVRRLAPDIPVGLIVSQSIGNVLREDLDFVAVRAALATVDFVSRAHALGKAVHAWTVNDTQIASALVDRGVDNLITDVPDGVRAALAERAQLEPAERLLLAYRNRRVP
jgi:glycerophosphoryl diester phosphodiesterase